MNPVFCSNQGCSKLAIGEVILIVWVDTAREHGECRIPVCGDCRTVAYQKIEKTQRNLPVGAHAETRFSEYIGQAV